MALTIPVAHDFNCAWCWVGFLQARRLQREFGVQIDWRAFEIHPETDPWLGEPAPRQPGVPSRFDLHLWAEQVQMPPVERERKMRTDKAHQAVEFAKTEGVEDALVEAIYRGYWEEARDINDIATLREMAQGIVTDVDSMEQAIASRTFADNVIPFNEGAYEQGVTHVPTFFIGGERYAEKQYHVLHRAVVAELEKGGIDVYSFLQFPSAPDQRPYTLIDMVMTIDGRIVSGSRDESVHDLGSKVDHRLMKRIEKQVDAVMLGAHTLRVTPPTWNPQSKKRIVVTRTGDVPFESAFLTGGEAFVAIPGTPRPSWGEGQGRGSGISITAEETLWNPDRTLSPNPSPQEGRGGPEVLPFSDLRSLLQNLRQDQHVKRLLVLGGSKLNGQLIREELVDEIFITIAPKVKLGHNLPTIAEGEAFERGELQGYTLVEHHVIGDEIFLRYRRHGR